MDDRSSPLHRGDPEWLGDYRLLGRLGSGGMGVVYLAEEPDGALVAIKLIHATLAHDQEFQRRFRSEVERARQVPSFCTAEVLGADLDHDPPYLVVEYVDGPSLADVVEDRGPLRAAALHSLAVGVATALSGIHGAGVIHRDLKPGNVLLAPGSPKVIDFGIARAFEATSRHTRTDQMVGTVAYMAPERFASETGAPLTAAADVFGWACVVAYAGTGRTPFQGDSPAATAARILTQPPHLDGLPQPLRDVVALALAKEPQDRPTARELLDLLLDDRAPVSPAPAAAVRPAPVRPAAVSRDPTLVADRGAFAPPAPARPRRRRGHRLLAVLAVLLVLAGIGTVGFVLNNGFPGTPVAGAPSPDDSPESSASAPGQAGGATPPAKNRTSAPPKDRKTQEPDDEESAAPEERDPQEPTGGQLVLQDALNQPDQWLESQTRAGDAQCLLRGVLRAELAGDGAFQCLGPTDEFADDTGIDVSVALQTAGSCAEMWFHWDDSVGGHVLSVCQDEISVAEDSASGQREELDSFRFDRRLTLRQALRVHLVVREGAAEVFLNGTFADDFALPDDGPDRGQIRLGLSAGDNAGATSAVTFADVAIRALPAAQ
ncbi:protein kinase [Actinoplanes sp. NPDC051859]|uniref:serine/threonine-protein kinase n=1 Tax=Actinoplanes sp. NPDC051859 TaxID=3363909 RepID=UPI003787EED3